MDWFQGWVRAVGGFHREGNEEVELVLVRLDREKERGGRRERRRDKRGRRGRERDVSKKRARGMK